VAFGDDNNHKNNLTKSFKKKKMLLDPTVLTFVSLAKPPQNVHCSHPR